RAKPWTPKYAHGMDDPVARAHPEWLVYRNDGTLWLDFGKHPVFDFNDPAYRKAYFSVIDQGVSNGLRDVYIDMAGAHSEVINHARDHDEPGLSGLIETFRGLRERGITIAIEGQNPLALDAFWFRPALYTDMTGREQVYVGMAPGTHGAGDEMALNLFRMGMFNAFPYVSVDGLANDFERTPGEMDFVREAGRLNPLFRAAIEQVGLPFVRKTDFGSVWTSERGAAVFVWHPVSELRLEWPGGWSVKMVLTRDGPMAVGSESVLRNLPHQSVILMGPSGD
ncbi:MAG: hypothetical protein U1E27_14060, partial [Kiritimatiellia bacterium]|nr:hypothetical protein [Kiritimatiellia bacterium]